MTLTGELLKYSIQYSSLNITEVQLKTTSSANVALKVNLIDIGAAGKRK